MDDNVKNALIGFAVVFVVLALKGLESATGLHKSLDDFSKWVVSTYYKIIIYPLYKGIKHFKLLLHKVFQKWVLRE